MLDPIIKHWLCHRHCEKCAYLIASQLGELYSRYLAFILQTRELRCNNSVWVTQQVRDRTVADYGGQVGKLRHGEERELLRSAQSRGSVCGTRGEMCKSESCCVTHLRGPGGLGWLSRGSWEGF